ncbi:MAG: thioredoxin [bacterium]
MADNVKEITDDSFDTEVIKSELPIVVDFWAPWCQPCKQIGPFMAEFAETYSGRLTVAKMDIQEHSQAATKFGIRSIPALLFFKDGNVVESMIGAHPKAKIQEVIDRVLE